MSCGVRRGDVIADGEVVARCSERAAVGCTAAQSPGNMNDDTPAADGLGALTQHQK